MPYVHFEDFQVGTTEDFGSATVSAAEIVAFGRAYDPQPFHTDEEAARRSPFGGLIASGWQSAAVAHRLLAAAFASNAVTYGSPGVDELRFLKPVRAGDIVRLRATVIDARPSQSKPDRGLIRLRMELLNQTGEVVLSMIGMTIFGRRP